MYLKSIHVENYRLLRDVLVTLDSDLTLFVGKNNTGKTSIMNIIELICSGLTSLPFDDYPIDCRQNLYSAITDYWNSKNENALEVFRQVVPVTKVSFVIDYSDGVLGNASAFIIDLDESINEAVVSVSFDLSEGVFDLLEKCKVKYQLIDDSTLADKERNKRIQDIVQDSFSRLFAMKVLAVNPSDPTDYLEKSKTELQNLFFLKIIKAERDMDESDRENPNPLKNILKAVFSNELEEMESDVQNSMNSIQQIVSQINFELNGQINTHLETITNNMLSFGYPSAEELKLHANASTDVGSRIIEDTRLVYMSPNATESLPSSHNGLGYKNLIKISLELHEYASEVKKDRTRLPLLLIEEPEAHMHPQLQTTFVMYVEDFLSNVVGEKRVQVLLTTHSAHVANTVDFRKIRYILRRIGSVECKMIANFPKTGTAYQQRENLDFLQKYMKLSYCDLYFCDKAILVEGASERLLLPNMITKCQARGLFTAGIPLSSQYYTIIEVGGAYAHRFYDFVEYLEIPTLILTDIDFANEHNKACGIHEATHTSNGAINRWCRNVFSIADDIAVPIDKVIGLSEEQRTDGYRHLEFETEENGFHPRSLEDAIINCNRELFGISNVSDPDFSSLGEKKTDFALKLLIEERYSNYKVPSYIEEGLVWLNNQSRMGVN